ncbi:MAG: RsiV family protein [Flavobacteriales bacterium]
MEGVIQNDGVFSGNWVSKDRSRKTRFVFHRRKVPGLTTQVMVYEMGVDATGRSKGDDEGTANPTSQFRASILTLNTSSPAIGKKINAIMASKLDAMINAEMLLGEDEFSNFVSLWQAVKQSKKESGGDAYELVIDSYVSYMDEHMVCLGISYMQYQHGNAHGWDSSQEFIFDLKTGNLITLKSLLTAKGKKSLNALGQKAIQKVIHHPALEGEDFKLTDNFTINPYGLLFVYRRGEISGSFADTPFDLFIPYSELKPLLKPESILSNYIKI